MSSNDTTAAGATLQNRMAAVPWGRWAVAVSGGADSIALLMLSLRHRPASQWHVAHLDHETRDGASAEDAEFVRQVCGRLGVSSTIRRISELDLAGPPANRPARFREARLHLFRSVIEEHQLAGVLQGHHAGDQAGTVLLRLLRGGPVTGIRPRSVVGGLTIVRPLLAATADQLRSFLGEIRQPWREDESNRSPVYQRNRARMWLAGKPDLSAALVRLGEAGSAVAGWAGANAPVLEQSPRVETIADLPEILGLESVRRWLVARGAGGVDAASCRRLLEMAADVATPASANFQGNLRVRRRSGRLFAENPGQTGRFCG
jgi:tRNA(Ile)-lysidine synthetase-like protein